MFRPHGEGDQEGLLEGLRYVLAGPEPTSVVKARREKLGISQRELARVSGVSQSVISRLEAGDQLPTNAQTGKLGVALKMGEHDLGLNESLAFAKRLAVKGKLPPEAAARVALHLLETQPTSEAGQRVHDAVLEGLLDIAKAASSNWSGVVIKAKTDRDVLARRLDRLYAGEKAQAEVALKGGSEDRPDRDGLGRRRKKPFSTHGRER